jgi:hypothetical protein
MLTLAIATVPLAGLAHQSLNAGGGSVPVWLVAPFVRPGRHAVPDGRLPAPRWRWPAWGYAAAGLLWITGAVVLTVRAIAGHHAQVDSSGNLLQLTGSDPAVGWFNLMQAVFFPVLAATWLASLARQVLGYRHSSGTAVSS